MPNKSTTRSNILYVEIWKKSASLKLVSTVFFFCFFFLHRMIVLKKLWKMFLILSKKLPSQDIQIFAFLSYPLTFPASQQSRTWSKITLKAYDIISCLSKTFTTYYLILKGLILKLDDVINCLSEASKTYCLILKGLILKLGQLIEYQIRISF